MSDPINRQAEQQREQITGIAPVDSLNAYNVQPPEPAPEYKQEPLFNKKVMVVWASFALAAWFVFTQVVPVAMESAKTAIRQAVKEAESNTAGGTRKVIILPNGKRIVITTDEPTVVGVPAPLPPVPPAAVEPAKAPAGATAPEPATKK